MHGERCVPHHRYLNAATAAADPVERFKNVVCFGFARLEFP